MNKLERLYKANARFRGQIDKVVIYNIWNIHQKTQKIILPQWIDK